MVEIIYYEVKWKETKGSPKSIKYTEYLEAKYQFEK